MLEMLRLLHPLEAEAAVVTLQQREMFRRGAARVAAAVAALRQVAATLLSEEARAVQPKPGLQEMAVKELSSSHGCIHYEQRI
jgi:hypothetical protein